MAALSLREKFLKRKIQRLEDDPLIAAAQRSSVPGALQRNGPSSAREGAVGRPPTIRSPHAGVVPSQHRIPTQQPTVWPHGPPAQFHAPLPRTEVFRPPPRYHHNHSARFLPPHGRPPLSSIPSVAPSGQPFHCSGGAPHTFGPPSHLQSPSGRQPPRIAQPAPVGAPPCLPASPPSSEAELVNVLAIFLLQLASGDTQIGSSIATAANNSIYSQLAVHQQTPTSSAFPIDASSIARRLRLHYRRRPSSSLAGISFINSEVISRCMRSLNSSVPSAPLVLEDIGLLPSVVRVDVAALSSWITSAQNGRIRGQIAGGGPHAAVGQHSCAATGMDPTSAPHGADQMLPAKRLRAEMAAGVVISMQNTSAGAGHSSSSGGGNLEESSSIESLLSAPSARERKLVSSSEELRQLLTAPTAKQSITARVFQNVGGSQLREFCEHGTTVDCCRANNAVIPCPKVHFRRIILPHTDVSLGDCSYLDTCRHKETCKFVHYEVEICPTDVRSRAAVADAKTRELERPHDIGAVTAAPIDEVDAQWIRCDLRTFDFTMLSNKVKVVMADPPWDIHMDLPYGTMTDHEMRNLRVDLIQDEGLLFLWVTGRAMELGRECLQVWGYNRVEEVVWVKTNQLQRIIRTGRTGHWINHSKEHCLVGIKGNPKINRNIDCDVIVAEVRETSRKPDEIYRIIERMMPGCLKVELFGRQHNVRKNWITLGNQLSGVELHDAEIVSRYSAVAPALGLPPIGSSRAGASSSSLNPSVSEGIISSSPSDSDISSAASVSLPPHPHRGGIHSALLRTVPPPPPPPPPPTQTDTSSSSSLSTNFPSTHIMVPSVGGAPGIPPLPPLVAAPTAAPSIPSNAAESSNGAGSLVDPQPREGAKRVEVETVNGGATNDVESGSAAAGSSGVNDFVDCGGDLGNPSCDDGEAVVEGKEKGLVSAAAAAVSVSLLRCGSPQRPQSHSLANGQQTCYDALSSA